jgi:3-methyladenine DNA glycosylase AlkD
MHGILAGFLKAHRDMSVREVNGLAAAMWKGPTTEEKSLAIGLLARRRKILDDASWRLADSWVEEAIGWGLSDSLAAGPIAAMVYDRPARFNAVLRWTKAKDIWRRRASTYSMHDLVLAKELDRPFRLLQRLLYDEEFWVQRAVGTWLRECWKRDTPRTEAFLRKHMKGLPKVVITVATERAPKAFREELRRKRG